MTAPVHPSVVEFWFDPVRPYWWTASRWLHEVGHRQPLTVQHRVMSLYLLNEHRTDLAPAYRRSVETSRGPARVATAAASTYGPEALERFYTAFGEIVFDHWRRPSAAEYHEVIRAALPLVGLPGDREDAMDSDVSTRRCAEARGGCRPGRWRGGHPDHPHRRRRSSARS